MYYWISLVNLNVYIANVITKRKLYEINEERDITFKFVSVQKKFTYRQLNGETFWALCKILSVVKRVLCFIYLPTLLAHFMGINIEQTCTARRVILVIKELLLLMVKVLIRSDKRQAFYIRDTVTICTLAVQYFEI